MNSISIIGCGWLGWPLAKKMKANGWSVKGSTTRKEKLELLKGEGIDAFLFDLYQKQSWDSELLNSAILLINIPPGRKRPNVAVDFPKFMSELALQITAETKVIFVSSTSVFGDHEGSLTETSEVAPSTASAKALVEVENLLRDQLAERLTILRPSGLVGDQRHPVKFLAGRSQIKNGAAPINLIHQVDVIRCIEAVIAQEQWGELFHLAMDGHPSKSAYYSWAAEQLGLAVPHFLAEGKNGKIVSNDKLKQLLQSALTYPNPEDFIPKQ